MKDLQKLALFRIGLGDYARSNSGPLYKEILSCARNHNVISASVFRSIDSVLMKGKPEMPRLFGGHDKSQAIIMEISVRQENKQELLSALREILQLSKDPVVISILDTEVEVFGLDP